jgi:hypothetical protein
MIPRAKAFKQYQTGESTHAEPYPSLADWYCKTGEIAAQPIKLSLEIDDSSMIRRGGYRYMSLTCFDSPHGAIFPGVSRRP